MTNQRVSRSIVLLSVLLWTIGTLGGCSTSEEEARLRGTFQLKPNETARLYVDAIFGEVMIVNDGPGRLGVRALSVGDDPIMSVIMMPNTRELSLFWGRRSLAFYNMEPNETVTLHYLVETDDPAEVERMEPRRVRSDDPMPPAES